MGSPKKRQLAYKFDCSGKDIDVSVNEADPNKRFQFLSVYWVKETDKYLFVNYLHCKDMDFFVTLHQKFKEKQVWKRILAENQTV